MATPFGAWGGLPGTGFPGFSDYLKQNGFSNEKSILTLLPELSPVRQVKIDINLNMNGIDAFPNGHLLYSNAKDKEMLIPIFKGEVKDPDTIKKAIRLVCKSKKTHQGRVANQATGSDAWNNVWLGIYDQWIRRLKHILGEINEA